MQWILHMDMDAFFASVEQMDKPELKGKPVIVGGGENRGVVSTCSYEARKFGVHSAMPIAEARRRCPFAVFLPVRMQRYSELSQQVMAVLHSFSPLVEQTSIDEAYMDATGLERLFGPVEGMALQIKERVHAETRLTCSVGLAPVKFLAKIASDMHKPDGLTVIRHEEMAAFLCGMQVKLIPGVGPHMLAALDQVGVRTCGDALRFPRDFWERKFGKAGRILWERCQGIDPRKVEPEREAKSEGAEITLEADTLDMNILKNWLFRQSDRVGRSLRRHGLSGTVVTLKIRYADLSFVTRRHTLPFATNATGTIFETACRLLDELQPKSRVRLIGVTVSGFNAGARQLFLPIGNDTEEREDQRKRLDRAMDKVNRQFGKGSVQWGRLFENKES